MQLATTLTPFDDKNLQLAAQSGVTHVVVRYPGPKIDDLIAVKKRVENFGLSIAAIEGYLPIENIKLGNELFDSDVDEMKQLVRNMAEVGIPIVCYNFMAGTDWVRTRTDAPERGGAWVTSFDIDQARDAISLDHDKKQEQAEPVTASQLWNSLDRFLQELLPVAEEHGVVLAMHPDDPPLDEFNGRERIMNCVENFERLVAMHESPSNGICFCQGTFAEMGVDIPATIERLGKHIAYVHFRDIRGTRERFAETFHDNGPTDMYAAIKAYRAAGFAGPIRPDHVPQLVGEEDGVPGYTMMGRLFAYGYMRGLIQAAEHEANS